MPKQKFDRTLKSFKIKSTHVVMLHDISFHRNLSMTAIIEDLINKEYYNFYKKQGLL